MPTVSQHYRRQTGSAAGAVADEARASAAPVVLMVSGGADSTALLLMACTSKLDISDGRGTARIARERLHVLHVNHHLRGEESDGDEAFVRDLCERYGLPLCVEHASFENLGGRNLEAAARDVRYAAARRYVHELSQQMGTPRSAARICTAHTASDRVETFFMNAIKGSGPAGLSSIPRRRNIIVRPLIDMTHADLTHYLEVAGQPWREDASNRDTTYLRNFVRHKVLPLIRERNDNVVRTVGTACEIMGDEDAFMSQLAAQALRTCVRREERGLIVLDAKRLGAAEVAIARRMVRLAVKRLDPEVRLEMRHVEAVLACVAEGAGSCTLPAGIDARVEFGTVAFRTPATRERMSAAWLSVPGSLPVSGGRVLEASLEYIPAGTDAAEVAREAAALDAPGVSTVYVDVASLGYAERDVVRLKENGSVVPAEARSARLWIDAPVAGDVMCPLGMHGRTKKVSDILNEAQVPVAERQAAPVVRTSPGGAVVWLAGVRVDDRFKCTARTRVALKMVMRPAASARR